MCIVHVPVRVCCSVADSDSVGGESGFDEQEVAEVQNSVIKFITRFIDKVSVMSEFLTL